MKLPIIVRCNLGVLKKLLGKTIRPLLDFLAKLYFDIQCASDKVRDKSFCDVKIFPISDNLIRVFCPGICISAPLRNSILLLVFISLLKITGVS